MRPLRAIAIAVLGLALLPALAAASAPTVMSFPPAQVRNQEATVRFAIDPNGLETEWSVEYGRTTDYGLGAGIYNWPLEAANGFEVVEQLIGGRFRVVAPLLPGAEYHYRVVAKNADGTTYGDDQTLTATEGTPPTAVSTAAVQIAEGAAVLNGTVDPEGTDLTGCNLHLINEDTFKFKGFRAADAEGVPLGYVVPCFETLLGIGAGTEPVPVHVAVSGLKPGVYYFRTEAENAYDEAPFAAPVRFEIAAPVAAPIAVDPDDLPLELPRLDPPALSQLGSGAAPVTLPAVTKATPRHSKKQQRKKHRHQRRRHGRR